MFLIRYLSFMRTIFGFASAIRQRARVGDVI